MFDLIDLLGRFLHSLTPPITDAERAEVLKTHTMEWSCRNPEDIPSEEFKYAALN